MNITLYHFSPTESSKKVAELVASGITNDKPAVRYVNLAKNNFELNVNNQDLAIFTCPVYGGRVPSILVERVLKLKGVSKAVVIVVYGNRDYDDALLELNDIVKDAGFNIIAAGAFVAQHNIFSPLGKDRPDKSDNEVAFRFGQDILQKLDSDDNHPLNISGNKPYKKLSDFSKLIPKGRSQCNECGLCATECPAEAIDIANPRVADKSKCISCMRCVYVCPRKARSISWVAKFFSAKHLKKFLERRKEPITFL